MSVGCIEMNASNMVDAKIADVEPNRFEAASETPPEGREARVPLAVSGTSEGAAAADDAHDERLFAIDESSDLPLWVQLRNRLAHLIRTGHFKAGEQLPSLRSLSAEARLNYNTVSKAYRDLETSGLIVSVRGRGMYVQKNVTVDDSPESAVDALAEQCIEEYRACGLSFRDIQRRLTGIVQAKSDEAAAVANEKREYYDGKH